MIPALDDIPLRAVKPQTVPYIPHIDIPLPGCIWQDLAHVRDALNAGVSDPAALRLVVACPCSALEQLLDIGQHLGLFELPQVH